MSHGEVRDDLIAVSSTLSLAQDVALLDQLGEDPVGGTLGDPDGGGDVAQTDSRVMSHAREDMGVFGQEVPAVGRCFRVLLLISRRYFHEMYDTFLTAEKWPGP